MGELFELIYSHGLVFGFISGFVIWSISKAISFGFHLFEL